MSYKGLTIYICFGQWAGFGVVRDCGFRFIVGWVSIAVLAIDVEQYIVAAAKHLPPGAAQ